MLTSILGCREYSYGKSKDEFQTDAPSSGFDWSIRSENQSENVSKNSNHDSFENH